MDNKDLKVVELFEEYLKIVSIDSNCDNSFIFYGGGSNYSDYSDYSDCYPSASGGGD